MKIRTLQEGQSLIVLVLVVALVLAIVSAASYRLTTQVQTGVLQEESVRALAAADTGIEVGLQKASTAPFDTYTYGDLGLGNMPGIDAARSRVLISDTSVTNFETPEISKDSQFTFYVQDFLSGKTTPYSGTITVSLTSPGGSTCVDASRAQSAVELTYIYGPSGEFTQRTVLDPCTDSSKISGATASTSTVVPNLANLRLIIARSLFGSSTFTFTGTTAFPPQGKNIRAEAYTISGPSKIVEVFQSLPQIPAEFFVTTF